MRKVSILSTLACAVLLVALAMALVREFSNRSLDTADAADLPTTAVVFTGQFDRVELALRLFDQGRVDRIFISGVNDGAGITPRGFADQFRLSANARFALGSGQIILAPDATTTLENALETACWLNTQPNLREIVLITGRAHIPRASWALENALAGAVSVHRLSPDPPPAHDTQSRWPVSELLKFGATVTITSLPRFFWSGVPPTTCIGSTRSTLTANSADFIH